MRWQGFPDDHARDSMCPLTSRRFTTRSCPGAENGIPAAARCVTRGDVNTDARSAFTDSKYKIQKLLNAKEKSRPR